MRSPYQGGPIGTPASAIKNAIELYVMSMFIYEAADAGRLSVDMLAPGLEVHSESGGSTYRLKRAWNQRQLVVGTRNMIVNAAGTAAIVVDTALYDRLGPGQPEDESEVGGLRAIMYMVRSAHAHDPFNPRWECRGPYLREYRIPSLLLTVDLRALDGQPFRVEDIGGWKTFRQLLEMALGIVESESS